MIMSIFLVVCLSLMVIVVHGEPYKCKNEYVPSNYRGRNFLRVPTNCPVITPAYCPRSWKSGIPAGLATVKPLIYSEFITCHEGFTSCGYVPIDPKTGLVLGTSGVTIGAGVDLGSKSRSSSVFQSVSSALLNKLEPYFGLKKNDAACAAIERPLHLSSKEANILTNAVKDKIVETVATRYNEDKDGKALAFASLPRGMRTAVVSVWFQFGLPKAYPNFWNFVKKNDWQGAVKELRNFYKNPADQQRGDIRRRNDEADIIAATLLKCDRSLDAVVLLDESGSVPAQSFSESLDFVKKLITAFPDDKLSGNDSTRFGLSTFSSNYKPHFFLSSYTSQSQYKDAVNKIIKASGGTKLGAALDRILVDQFTERRGLRSEERGFPRVLIVLTDGKSHDNVALPAKRVRDQNIVIYAIGIGNYNLAQLNQVASSHSHVYLLSTFSELETFVATLTATTCNEPQPISLKKEVKATAKKREFEYFLYKVNTNSNLKITVNDLSGQTALYASRDNPHPYKYDNDISFDTSYRKDKVIVISPKPKTPITKRSTGGQERPIYISITADTELASFTMEGDICDPLNCTEGTNEVAPPSYSSYLKSSRFFNFAVITLSFVLFCFY